MDIPEIQTIVDKLAHKKFFAGLVGIAAIFYLDVPGDLLVWKILGITVVSVAVIVCQTILDKKEKDQGEP